MDSDLAILGERTMSARRPQPRRQRPAVPRPLDARHPSAPPPALPQAATPLPTPSGKSKLDTDKRGFTRTQERFSFPCSPVQFCVPSASASGSWRSLCLGVRSKSLTPRRKERKGIEIAPPSIPPVNRTGGKLRSPQLCVPFARGRVREGASPTPSILPEPPGPLLPLCI